MSAPKSDQFDIWKAIQPQVVIVNNPMYFVQLRRETKSKLVWFFDHFKSFTERWFSHILLLMSLFLYGCFGAWIFMMIEGQAEVKYKEPISNMVEDFKREFWYQSHVMKRNKTAISKLIELRMGEFERQLLENFNAGIIGNIDQVAWTFWDALFFCVTIFTTIGYGHVTLKTDLGRGFTMIYAFIGIPLVLMVLTDLGKLFTRAIKATFLAIRRFLYAHGFRKVKSASRRVAPTQYVTNVMSTIRRLSHVPLMGKRNGSGDDKEKLNPDGDKNNNNNNNTNTNPTFKSTTLNIELPFANSKPVEPVDQSTEVKDPPKNQPTKIYKTPAIFASEKKGPIFPGPPPPTVIISTNPTPPMTAYVESRPGSPITPETPAPFAVDDEFNLPVSLALFILVLYILIGSFIFTHTDNWRLFESFYFVYISMSTIGFGDYVPKSSVSMIASSVYLLFGLALTSMCINVIQERLSESFEKAKVSLGAQLGFDMNQAPPIGQPHVDPAPKHEAGKQVGFELKPNNIGQSLRERRERRKSSERSTPSDKNSDRSSNGDSDRLSQALSELESIKIPDDDEKSRSPSPIKYSDL